MAATKVLLVEDEQLVQRMYDRGLSMEGYDVYLAHDGTIVLESVELNQPNIIVLDIMMPNFNGLETLAELRSKYSKQQLPVIILSARDDPEIIKQALDAGANKYLVKSMVELPDIIAAIKEVTGQEADGTPLAA